MMEIKEKIQEWEKKYKLKHIGTGRNRKVFRHGNYVIKFPLNECGIYDNYFEYKTYKERNPKNEIQFAPCRLIDNILVMQFAGFVGPLSDDKGYIPWAKCPQWAYSIDCLQVGYNQFEQIVAYDYGFY